MQNFKECISIVLSRWTAIKLITDLDLGGDHNATLEKISILKDSVFNFFVDYGTKVDEYDLSDNMSDYLSEEFGVQLEDNSSSQVSKSLIEYYTLIVVQARTDIMENLRRMPNTSNYKCESSDESSIESLIQNMDIDIQDKNMPIKKEAMITEMAQEFMTLFMIKTAEFEKSPSKQGYAALQKEFNDAMDYLTPYDQKTCLQKLTAIKELIAKKTKKFSFSKKLAPVVAPQVEQDLVKDQVSQSEFPQGAYVLSKVSNQDFAPDELEEKDVYLYDLESCNIDLRGIKKGAVHARNISKCFIVSNPIHGSFLVHGCVDTRLVMGCKQFRIHDSKNVFAFLLIPSDPIIEDCTEMTFGKYPFETDNIWYKTIHNHFDQVKDFNWHKKAQSPNWKLATETDYVEFKINL